MMRLAEAVSSPSLLLEWFKTTIDLVKSLAWPLLVLFTLLEWRAELSAILKTLPHLVDRIKSGKFGPVEVELEPEQIPALPLVTLEMEKQLAELVPRLNDRLATGKFSSTDIHLVHMVAPESAGTIAQIGEHEIRARREDNLNPLTTETERKLPP